MAAVLALAGVAEARPTVRYGQALVTPAMDQLEVRVLGRTAPTTAGGRTSWAHSWPGVSWTARFQGSQLTLRFDDNADRHRVLIDGVTVANVSRPGRRDVKITGLGRGAHIVRLVTLSENQGKPATFGGFFVNRGRSLPAPRLPTAPQIEFVGDSWTVGYGNSSPKRTCTADEIWATTDVTRAFGYLVGAALGAEFQVNAISGRGVVRNYGGAAGDTLPEAYPKTLFEGGGAYVSSDWSPSLIIVGLGTNDFSTPLKDGEKWPTRTALHTNFEATYAAFVRRLRAAHPSAFIVLMASDGADGEIEAETRKVLAALKADGETRLDFIPIRGLDLGGCDYHPSARDHETLAALVLAFVRAHPEIWR